MTVLMCVPTLLNEKDSVPLILPLCCCGTMKALDEERERNFLSLVETDAHSLVPNTEELDCPICLCSIPPGEGATLRECLHVFCRYSTSWLHLSKGVNVIYNRVTRTSLK